MKLLIHFDTNNTCVYELKNNILTLLEQHEIFFNETLVNDELFYKLNYFFAHLQNQFGIIDNKRVRLYATGIFQEFSKEEQNQLVIYVYTHFGLMFNIIQPDLEKFYLNTSIKNAGNENLVKGLVCQEFRKVVICGSFQQHMNKIKEIMSLCEKHNIQILSPWTKNVVPETLGTDFILLQGQTLLNERDSWRHKYDHMNKFIKADAIIICNPDGTIGKGTMFEFGFMIAHGKRIIFTNEPIGLTIKFPYEIGLNFNKQ